MKVKTASHPEAPKVAPLVFTVVRMDEVPTPPVESRGRWGRVYSEMRKLGLGERQALRIDMNGDGLKGIYYARSAMRKLAKQEKLQLCTSHTDDHKFFYCWLVKQE